MTGETDSARSTVHGPADGGDPLRGYWQWWVIILLGIGTLCLGWFGFSRYYAVHGQSSTFWHTLYVSLQLFTIESGPVPAPVPLELNIARFLAPVVPAWALVRTFLFVFGDRLRALRLRRQRGHVVVCGLGRRGMQLVRDFRECGSRVLAIECDPDNANVKACRDLGVPVLIGSAADLELLRKARADRPEHVIAVCGDDGTNVNIAVLVYQLVRDRSTRINGRVRCSIQVSDLRLATLLQKHHILSETEDRFVASIFNTYRTSARQLFREHPLDYERIACRDARQVHLVIVGFGKMGESLALQAAMIGCFANGKKLRVTAIDRIAGLRERDFTGEHPEVGHVMDVSFVEGDAEDPAILEQLRGWVDEKDSIATIAVCLDDDSRSLSCALGVLSRLGDRSAPLLVRMSDDVGLATLLEDEHGGEGWAGVHSFGTVPSACTREALLQEELDALARAIHEDYRAKRLAEGRSSDDASMRPWEKLDESLKNSSRASADHIPVKLRAIGCYVAGEGDESRRVSRFEPDEVKLLGKMEHARWCAERLLAGWLPSSVRAPAEKKTPYLVEWNELSDDVKQYDFDIVEGIPRFLEAVGLRVYRGE
ncbi:NAD-binding protein [bacterium]|nr:NAD-binding protein [bacterium]